MAMVLKAALSAVTKGPDVTDLEPRGDLIHYKAKIDGFTKTGAELRVRAFSIWDLPPKRAENVTLTAVRRGAFIKEYLAEYDVKAPRTVEEGRLRVFGNW